MICPRSPWRTLQLTSLAHRSVAHNQRRCKAFVRRIDRNNEVYYTISNKRPPKSPEAIPVRDDFFEMPDLLLDLDAEDSRFVRPVDEADDERLERKWDVNAKRLAVQDHLKQLQEQIAESRRKADDVLSNPTNVWRLNSHDVLSAALRCSPPAAVDQTHVATTTSDASHSSGRLALRQDAGFIETLCRENGIPPHALQDDRVLLEWMLLRYNNLERSKTNRSEAPPTPSQLAVALRDQTSITGIRRLVFQSLSSGEAAKTYFSKEKGAADDDSWGTLSVSQDIRDACASVLDQCSEKAVAHLEILSFIGNLASRLSLHSGNVGPALTGLALQLSAASGVIGATSEWLYRGFVYTTWEQHAETSGDVAAALQTFIQRLRSTGEGAHDRQLLLQLLTGIDENSTLLQESFRSLPLLYLGERSKVSTDDAYDVYASYITLLGHLGAVRTLWKEWHVSRPIVTRYLKPSEDSSRLEDLYAASLLDALRVAAPLETRSPPDMELSECVALDYHSIGAQDMNSWAPTSNQPRSSASRELPSFNLPLDEWITKLDEAMSQDSPLA